MKKFWYILFAAMVVLTACEDKNGPDGSAIDPRDAVVGEYEYVTTGNLDIYAAGVKAYTFPLNTDGDFRIAKLGNMDSVVIVGAVFGAFDSIPAVLHGNKIELGSNSYNYDSDMASLKVTLSNVKAKFEENVISWETDIMGIGTFSSYSITGEGELTLVAVKKQE